MAKVAVVTDSNSGITLAQAKAKGVFIVPMPFIIDGNEYEEEISLSQEEFYKKLIGDASISTSQPSTYALSELWSNILKDYDEIIYIPMSSGLSNSCQTATILSHEEEFEGKVHVLDLQRISVTQKTATYEAKYLLDHGKSCKEVCDYLMETKMHASIYIMVDTLKYLKRGGRVTPAAAALANLLNIKPVLQIQGQKLDSFTKVLSVRVARIKMINAIKADMETRFKDEIAKGEVILSMAYTNNIEEALDFKKQIEEAIPELPVIFCNPLSLSVSCHIGPGALAVTIQRSCIKDELKDEA
jgi:DegV family protein with EDD domain